MQKTEAYDLIFSIGEACSCTEGLRKLKLQETSYPFDWLWGATFLDRIKILTSGFKNFINLEDLTFSYCENSISCDAYANNFNNLIFNHDFPKDVPISSSYNQIKEKYERRINRLLNKINYSQKVLLVYVEIPNTYNPLEDDKVLLEAQILLEQAFPKTKCNILYVKHDITLPMYVHNYSEISETILKVTLYNKCDYPGCAEHVINPENLLNLLKNYQLNKIVADAQKA